MNQNSVPAATLPKWLSPTLLGLSLILMGIYFSWDTANMKQSAQWRDDFYDRINFGWRHTSLSDIKTEYSNPEPNRWHDTLLRAALTRWRLRAESPAPFEYLMEGWAASYLTVPNKNAWEDYLTDIDKDWRGRRRESLRAGESVEVALAQTDNALRLRFGDGLSPSRLGSLIEAQLRMKNRSLPKAPIECIFLLERYGVQTSIRRLGQVEISPIDPAQPQGDFLVRVLIDLSWDPLWLHPATIVSEMALARPGGQNWALAGLTPGDSPYLPVAPEAVPDGDKSSD